MKRATRELWRSAKTLVELGALTALWLEGAIESQPGYQARTGPDKETLPLIPVLARINRAGYMTDCSQPGTGPAVSYGGHIWCQRAAVAGFASPEMAGAIEQAAHAAGLMVRTTVPGRRFRKLRDRIPVTTCAWKTYTVFGGSVPRKELEFLYQDCGDAGLAAVCGAVQLTVVDPEWGRVDSPVWSVLDIVARQAGW